MKQCIINGEYQYDREVLGDKGQASFKLKDVVITVSKVSSFNLGYFGSYAANKMCLFYNLYAAISPLS